MGAKRAVIDYWRLWKTACGRKYVKYSLQFILICKFLVKSNFIIILCYFKKQTSLMKCYNLVNQDGDTEMFTILIYDFLYIWNTSWENIFLILIVITDASYSDLIAGLNCIISSCHFSLWLFCFVLLCFPIQEAKWSISIKNTYLQLISILILSFTFFSPSLFSFWKLAWWTLD